MYGNNRISDFDLNYGFNYNNTIMKLTAAPTKQEVDSIIRGVRGRVEKLNKLDVKNQSLISKIEDIIEKGTEKSDKLEAKQERAILNKSIEAAKESESKYISISDKLAQIDSENKVSEDDIVHIDIKCTGFGLESFMEDKKFDIVF